MKSQKSSIVLVGILFLGLGLFLSKYVLSSETQLGALTKFADKYETDKGSSKHKYTEIYEHFFYPIRGEVRKTFEIGVFGGASMRMFHDYFPNAEIHGIDIAAMPEFKSKKIKTYVADQSNREELEKVMDASKGNFDIILDDGGHTMEQQQISFGCLFKYLKSGGYYIIEDLHTSFFGKDYGAKKDGSNSTIAMVNRFIEKGVIESPYMTRDEEKYLTSQIEYCNLFSRNQGGSIAGIFKKK